MIKDSARLQVKWKYYHRFVFGALILTIRTNHPGLYQLIGNFFDFPPPLPSSSGIRPMKFELSLHVLKPTADNLFAYESMANDRHVLSSLKNRLVDVQTDLAARKATVLLYGFDESIKERLFDYSVIQPLNHLLGRHGFFSMHASLVTQDRKGIFIVGPKACGKSTLALTLAFNGFQFMCDDDCFVQCSVREFKVYALPTKMGLNAKILKRYPQLAGDVLKGFTYGNKKRISLRKIQAVSERTITSGIVLFPGYRPKGRLCLRSINPSEGVKKLMAACPCVYPGKLAQDMVWTFYALSKHVRFYEIRFNDRHLDQMPALVQEKLL